MEDTPRTQAACDSVYAQGVAHIPLVGFMEQLERELAEVSEDNRRNEDALWSAAHELVKVKQELAGCRLAEFRKASRLPTCCWRLKSWVSSATC
jgi:hypothetical protein